MTEISKEDYVSLEQVPCIHYPLRFCKNTASVRALIDSSNEVNTITPVYASQLGLKVHPTDIKAQNIDGCTLNIFGMVLANFQVENKLNRAQFFQETFLVAITTLEVIYGMFFFTPNRVNIQFI